MESLESDLQFVTKPSQDYFCPVCTEILAEPFLSDCGHHLCGSCRDRLLTGNKAECPVCEEPDLLKNSQLNKHLQRQVKDLMVYCSHHEKGCKWKGELHNLQDHLDPVKRRCGYVRVPCSFQCGELVPSGAVKEHKRSHCRKRPYTCKYCGYHNALDVVTDKHMLVCRQFPVDCPNNCETNGLKRHQLQSHIKQCPLEIAPCSFSSIGCTARLPRKEMEAHEEQAWRQHLKLVLKAIEPKQTTIVTPPPLDTLYLVNLPPVKYTIMDYVERKLAGEEWVSPPFYSHPQGYKMCLEVVSTNDQENLSVYVHVLQGEYDDELIWPFEGRVSVELVNWKEDKGHHEENFGINIILTDYSLLHVSKNDSKSIAGKPHFIPHSSLSYDPASNTEYLHDDCLCVRVKSVDVYSTRLVHKTPTWQDSQLAPSMPAPLCEFTIAEFSKRKKFDNRFYSPSFYTHQNGIEMCIVVDANGFMYGKGSHISVFLALMTKNDSPTLQSFQCDVVVELLNWNEDKDHFSRTISLNSDCLFLCNNGFGTSIEYRRFIPYSSLLFHTYLQNDCLRMRVKSVQFYSTSATCSSSEQSSLLEVTLTEFSKRRQFNNAFYSSPFYSHLHGYKLYFRCDANRIRKTSYLSVHVFLMRGEYDHHLHWPCDCSIGVELVNWRENRGHILKWISIASPQVIDADMTAHESKWCQFVSHASLAYDSATNTEYLHDDCLRLRVVGVKVYSTDLLLKTPSWQNSSATSQSVCEFTLTEFSKRKALNNKFYSNPFYTHPEGYKLQLQVYTNGEGSCAGTHISVSVAIMKGEYDDQLQWPFEGTIKVNMLNWREAKGHISKSLSFNRARTGDAACLEDMVVMEWGYDQFCAHSSLAYDPSTNTEYLQDDCLRIQVPSVEVYSTALLLKTPAWQDPLTYTKPRALLEFTLTKFSRRKQSDNKYYSPSFYTHMQGYKICVCVFPNGHGSGKSSHVSVFIYHMKGEHDDQLHWPFQGDVVLEVLNWQEDKGHYKKIVCIGKGQNTNRVTETNMASYWGKAECIPHTSLIHDPTTNTEYVQDDCLRLRVSAVNVYSGPLMLKTPAWQDSSATAKPLHEFTLTELTKRKELGYKYINSVAFYFHTHGYKLALRVDLNVGGIVILAILLNGNYDEELEWPATLNFTIELLNWRENKKHRKATATGPTNKKPGHFPHIKGSKLSIPYSSLRYDPLNNTEYLQDDCLRLRVLNNDCLRLRVLNNDYMSY